MDSLGNTVERVDEKLDGIAATLQSLARIEERQMNTSERLSEGAGTMRDHEARIRALEISVPKNLDTRVNAIELAMPKNLDTRLASIETNMPGLKETRKWIIAGLLASFALTAAAVAHLVIK